MQCAGFSTIISSGALQTSQGSDDKDTDRWNRGSMTGGQTTTNSSTTAAATKPAEPTSQQQPRQISRVVAGALIALMAISTAVHLGALRRDLPLQEPDESAFVRRAVHIAATRDPNPHWFGHPGSTVIYPLAAAFRASDTILYGGPVLGASPALTDRFEEDPTPFYVVGRLWTIAFSVGAIPLLFLVGRRAFNTRVALIAAATWVALPDPVHFGRIVRTDSAGVFFGLLSLWLCLRILDEPRLRWCLLAGISVGLAIASRYFMVALVPCLLAAAVIPHHRLSRPAVRASGMALAGVVGGFALSTPYFFLDWHTAWASLQSENEPMVGIRDLGPLGNLRWYVGTAIPASLTWVLVGLAAAGILIALWRRRPAQLILLVFGATFLVGICASKLHWARWLIEILPVLVLFAGATVDTVIQRLQAWATGVPRAAVIRVAALVIVTAVLVIHPAVELAAVNRRDASPSTSGVALNWIQTHIRPGSRLLVDPTTLITSNHTRLHVDERFFPATDTLAGYRQSGYDYLVMNGFRAGRYLAHSNRYPRATAFYFEIMCHSRLAAAFPTTATRRGAGVRIYDLDQRPVQASAFCPPERVAPSGA